MCAHRRRRSSQRAAEQRRTRQHQAVIRAEHQANQVRWLQADEANRASSRDAGRSQYRADEKHAHSQGLDRGSEHARLQLAAREQIEMTNPRRRQGERGRNTAAAGQDGCSAKVAHQPEQHATQLGLLAEAEQQAHDRARAGCYYNAGQQ